MVLKNNIILDSYGDIGPSNGDHQEGSGTSHNSYGIGIFFMGSQTNCTVINNTIAGSRDRAILTDKTLDSVFTNNTFFGNRVGLYFNHDSARLLVRGNRTLTAQIHHRHRAHVGLDFSSASAITMNDNWYANPYSGIVVQKGQGMYSLPFWQARFSAYDQQSAGTDVVFNKFDLTGVESGNWISNGTFDSSVAGWSGAAFEAAHPQMDGGCARIDFAGGAVNLSYSPGFVPSGIWLNVTLDAVASGFFHLYGYLSDPPYWTAVNIEREEDFVVDGTRRRFNLFFLTQRTLTNAQLRLSSRDWLGTAGTNYWIDNVVMRTVSVAERRRGETIIDPAAALAATADCVLLANPFFTNCSYHLPAGIYADMHSNTVDTTTVRPYESLILLRTGAIPEPGLAGLCAVAWLVYAMQRTRRDGGSPR